MNSKFLLTLIMLIASASYVLADSINTAKQEYWLGETVQAEVSVQDFSLAKLSFTDNSSNKVPVGFLTSRIDGQNFVYFNIPTGIKVGDYYLKAKDQRIIQGVLQDFEISSKITLIGNLGMSIDPAIITLDPAAQEIKISISNNAETEMAVNISSSHTSFKPARNPLPVEAKNTRNAFIGYNYSAIESDQIIYLSYSNRSYSVRVLLPKGTEKKNISITEAPKTPEYVEELRFQIQKPVEKKVSRYTTLSDPLDIKSTARRELHNLKFTMTGNLNEIAELKLLSYDTLPSEGSIEQYVWVNKDKKALPGVYEGDIVVKSDEGYSDALHLKITLEEIALAETNLSSKPVDRLFNQTRISLLINETKVKEKPDVAKNVTIALIMLVIVLAIAIVVGRKLRRKTVRKPLEEYLKAVKKSK